MLRLDWAKNDITTVSFETAGMSVTDQDCELKFTVGQMTFSIDIAKEQQLQAIKIYRLITRLCQTQQQNARLKAFTSTLPQIHINLPSGVEAGPVVTAALTTWIDEALLHR